MIFGIRLHPLLNTFLYKQNKTKGLPTDPHFYGNVTGNRWILALITSQVVYLTGSVRVPVPRCLQRWHSSFVLEECSGAYWQIDRLDLSGVLDVSGLEDLFDFIKYNFTEYSVYLFHIIHKWFVHRYWGLK